MGIEFVINPKIVRGLDYYTKTVFEFISYDIGSQAAVCAGGRYDGLIEQLGGQPTPALGFGMGIERLLIVMDKQECDYLAPKKCDIYFATMGDAALEKAMELTRALREYGYYAEYDLMGRGLKAQMKYANKLGAKYTVVIGDSELESGIVRLKNMESGEQTEVTLESGIIETFYDMGINDTMALLNETVAAFEGFVGMDRLLGENGTGEE